MQLADYLLPAGVAAILVVGAASDLRARRIPNLLTIGGAVAGMLFNATIFGVHGVGDSLAGWAVGCLLLLIPFLQRAIGAGDVKLLAAVGAWGGPAFVFRTLVLGAIAGGIIAIGYLIACGYAARMLSRIGWKVRLQLALTLSLVWPDALRLIGDGSESASHPDETLQRSTIPYGAALAVGGIAALLVGGS